MIPIRMQRIDDCWRACLASILEIPYEETPYLGTKEDLDPQWFEKSLEFINSKGLHYIEFKLGDDLEETKKKALKGFHMIIGESKLYPGNKHCCIGLDGKLIFDPSSKEGAGIIEGTETYGLFTSMNPAKDKCANSASTA
jgi:hypothetical protein